MRSRGASTTRPVWRHAERQLPLEASSTLHTTHATAGGTGGGRAKALLIGNGPNLLSGRLSWARLLQDLSVTLQSYPLTKPTNNDSASTPSTRTHSVTGSDRSELRQDKTEEHLTDLFDNNNTSFSMIYEELYLEALRRNAKRGLKETLVKQAIADMVQRELQPNDFHHRIMTSIPDCSHILTTNYDYNLERSCGIEQPSLRDAFVAETSHSLFRRHDVQYSSGGERKVSVWHLHGEAMKPSSILLGYEHYSSYLNKVRGYVIDGLSYQSLPEEYQGRLCPLIRRVMRRIKSAEKHQALDVLSWVDLFFASGHGLDREELHIWWLFVFRARSKLLGNKLGIDNTITYYTPSWLGKDEQKKCDRLRAVDVHVHQVESPSGDWPSFYNSALEHIANR